MKIAILSIGTRGDVQPSVALGKALKARGHDVLLAAPENFSSWVEGHGLAFRSLGIDMRAFIQSPEVRQAIGGRWFMLARIWRRTILPVMHKALEATWHAAREAEVIVYHPKAGGAVDVAEATGAALVCAAPIPIFPTRAFPLAVFTGDYGPRLNLWSYKPLSLSRLAYLRMINRWRANMLGLGKGPAFLPVGGHAGGLASRLCAVSPTVVPRPKDWDAGVHMTGYWFLDDGADDGWRAEPALAAFLADGAAPIYIGFGSMTTRDPARLAKEVIEGVQRAGVRAILATGWGGLESVEVPDTVHVIAEAPHTKLFRHVSAVVHHGGAGTTAAGLRAGLPTLICPLAFDQPFWGQRVRSLGCGPEPQPMRRLSAERFAEGLADLIRTRAYRRRAAEVAGAIAQEDGLADAVSVVEAARC